MKYRFAPTALVALAVMFAATSCSSPSASPGVSAAPTTEVSTTPTPSPTDVKIDVSSSKSGKTSDGIEVTFVGTRIAAASEIGSQPVAGMVPVVVQFEYQNTGTNAAPLQPVPLTVFYGADMYEADSPTLYQGGTASTELPKQITAGSTVKVANTFWTPPASPLTVKVDPSGSASQQTLPLVFSGIFAQ